MCIRDSFCFEAVFFGVVFGVVFGAVCVVVCLRGRNSRRCEEALVMIFKDANAPVLVLIHRTPFSTAWTRECKKNVKH